MTNTRNRTMYDLSKIYTPQEFELVYKRKFDCTLCDLPVWAYVDQDNDKYFLECGCGPTEIRTNIYKYRELFIHADIACGIL